MSLLIVVLLFALVVVGLLVRSKPPQDDADYRGVMVDLHAIRRRFDVARFKLDTRRDAADIRRELRDELRRLDEREW